MILHFGSEGAENRMYVMLHLNPCSCKGTGLQQAVSALAFLLSQKKLLRPLGRTVRSAGGGGPLIDI